ncbi:hypothetical protein Taro_040733, partial [Colocasia esculenta]|nr:hypothetical protein [Colocasia esculenta]
RRSTGPVPASETRLNFRRTLNHTETRGTPTNTALQFAIPRPICCYHVHHSLPTSSRRPSELTKKLKGEGGRRGGERVGKRTRLGSALKTQVRQVNVNTYAANQTATTRRPQHLPPSSTVDHPEHQHRSITKSGKDLIRNKQH